ncbi:hypothetical protein EDB85DRAFT_1898660 [Lactarius pseudohatsudake]|nr:hypothetical protein EDB85DRAFT_1898660 [Lactarius pseudohatsudake]
MDVEGKPVVTGTQSVESRKGTEAENVPQIKVSTTAYLLKKRYDATDKTKSMRRTFGRMKGRTKNPRSPCGWIGEQSLNDGIQSSCRNQAIESNRRLLLPIASWNGVAERTAYRVYIAFKDNPQTVKYQRGNEKEHGDKRDSYFEELLPSLDAPREGELRRSAQPSPYERAAIRARSYPSRLTKEHGVQADMSSVSRLDLCRKRWHMLDMSVKISRRDDPDTEHVSQRKTDSPRAAAALCEDENGE